MCVCVWFSASARWVYCVCVCVLQMVAYSSLGTQWRANENPVLNNPILRVRHTHTHTHTEHAHTPAQPRVPRDVCL